MSRVAIVRCEAYEQAVVRAALSRALDLLGGVEGLVGSGENVVVKPNLLVPSTPDRAVTTHPAVFRAVAEALLAAGAKVKYGDSPAVGSAAMAARRAGLMTESESLGVDLVEFDSGRDVGYPAGMVFKQFHIANAVLEADCLVSVPKLKTHGLTRLTGAVKNQLGCVPGLRKGQWHACAPEVMRFCQMLVDLNRVIGPRLTVLDAVVAMEGNGPRGGDPRHLGLLVVSDDPVAVDATACRLVRLDPSLVPTVGIGSEWGLGTATEIEYVGDELGEFAVEDFAADRSPLPTAGSTGRLSSFVKGRMAARPQVQSSLCTSCGLCVDVCPVSPRAVRIAESTPTGGMPHFDYDACIRCFCCQEVCPEGAIEIGRPLLGRILSSF